MLASLIAALLAALCYGVASVMQAVAVREASNRSQAQASEGGVDASLVPRMLHQWRFVASMGIDFLGFIAQLVALQRLPLFAVQAMVAANLAVIAVLATVLMGATLSLREWLAVIGVVAGVGLLGSSAGAEGASTASAAFKIALIVATAVLGVAGLVAARMLRDPARTLVLGTVAGFGFGAVGIAARVLNGFAPLTLLRDPAAYAVAAAGIVSFVFYATALEGAASPWRPRRSFSPRRCRRRSSACSSSATRPGQASPRWRRPASLSPWRARSRWPGSARRTTRPGTRAGTRRRAIPPGRGWRERLRNRPVAPAVSGASGGRQLAAARRPGVTGGG